MSQNNQFEIEKKRLAYLYENLPSSMGALFIIVFIILFVYQDLVPKFNLNIWVEINIFFILLRFLTYFSYKKSSITLSNLKTYYNSFFILSTMSAVALGSSSFLILPESLENMLIIVIFILGLLAGATITLASRVEIFISYLFLVFLPYLYIFATQENSISTTFAASTLLYLVVLTIIAKKVSTIVNNNIIYSIKNQEILKSLELKAQEATIANKAKSKFLSVMSHEIRTPLNAIVGFVEILQKSETDMKKLKYLTTINQSSQVLVEIINDILDLSKIEAGKLTLENVTFDPNSEFESLYLLYEQNALSKNINFINSISQQLPKNIESDLLRVKQIITNLLSNALKFTPDNKNIELIIEFNKKNSTLHCEVKDEGIGISKENISKITQMFTQADASTVRKYGGTGLGLSIVTKLLKLLHSELIIESELGKGSSFRFDIPVKIKTDTTRSQIDTTSIEGKELQFVNKKILVAEDNKTNQMLISILLEEMGIEIVMANDGVEAEEYYKKEKFDLVLMDINMPHKNGIEAMKAVREFQKQTATFTPIIALTANALNGDKESYINNGFDDYLSKPLDAKKLTLTLQKYFKGKE